MKQIKVPVLIAALAFLITQGPHDLFAQAPDVIYHSGLYAVNISMETVADSHSPIVSLAIKNVSGKRIDRDDCSSDPRVWVQGEHGEPPTTYRERFATMRLLPGEPELACTLNMSWSLAPGESMTKHILLKYLYDLHQPGKYSVFIDFPTGEGLLRSNTVTFEVMPEGRPEDKHQP
ncbi:MAG: hypothetical protein WAL75_14100 [Terracidiphilus sp.]